MFTETKKCVSEDSPWCLAVLCVSMQKQPCLSDISITGCSGLSCVEMTVRAYKTVASRSKALHSLEFWPIMFGGLNIGLQFVFLSEGVT